MMFVKRLRQIVAGFALCAVLMSTLNMPASAAFQDVPAGHWAEKEIQRCVENGFFKGISAESFGLGQPMTRSAAVVVLCRFFGWETPTPANPTCQDVPVNIWYAGAVQAAYDHGALTTQEAEFRPTDPITREELAVMLVRALGYGTIAGLAQNAENPFEDVSTNAGYITMAYDLGLMGGTSATAFSGEKAATREQVAVILMRLYDKLQRAKNVEKIAILDPAEEPGDLTGYTAVAIPAAKMSSAGKAEIEFTLQEEELFLIREAVRQSGAKELLYIEGSTACLNKNPEEIVACLKDAVETGGYDGIFLDIPQLKTQRAASLTRLIQELKGSLQDKLVYVMAEAPAQQGTRYDGYQYAALSKSADRVVLRMPLYEQVSSGTVAAPLEPLEEIYDMLRSMEDVDTDRLSLLLTSKNTQWTNRRKGATMSGKELEALLAEGTLETYYSERYACAYFAGQNQDKKPIISWYLDENSVIARKQMLGLFGVNQVCLADANTASAELLSGLQ